jgi:hypothetical protein
VKSLSCNFLSIFLPMTLNVFLYRLSMKQVNSDIGVEMNVTVNKSDL